MFWVYRAASDRGVAFPESLYCLPPPALLGRIGVGFRLRAKTQNLHQLGGVAPTIVIEAVPDVANAVLRIAKHRGLAADNAVALVPRPFAKVGAVARAGKEPCAG